MLAQGDNSSADPIPPTDTPEAQSSTTHIRTPSIPDLDGATREELIASLRQEKAQNAVLELKLRRLEQERRGAVHESVGNDAGGDESLENGRQLPPPPPQHVSPNIRMYLPDMHGMRVEHPSDIEWNMTRTRSGDADHAALVTNLTRALPTMERSEQHVVATTTTPAEERCEILIQALKQYQATLDELKENYKKSSLMNHSLLMEFNASKTAVEEKTEQVVKLEDENATKDDIIKKLNKQLQEVQNDRNRGSLRPGVKRGRFIMSKVPVLECIHCKVVFASKEEASKSICCHHPQPACPLPNKMVAEMFPEDVSKQRYWPCCKKISTMTPPPCLRGNHALQLV